MTTIATMGLVIIVMAIILVGIGFVIHAFLDIKRSLLG